LRTEKAPGKGAFNLLHFAVFFFAVVFFFAAGFLAAVFLAVVFFTVVFLVTGIVCPPDYNIGNFCFYMKDYHATALSAL